jgi:hypothetical protein
MVLLAVTLPSSSQLFAQNHVAAVSLGQPAPSVQGPAVPPAPPAQEQPEVLSRGPVHEAFAEPVTLQPEESLVAPVQPPPAIAEVPPAEKPEGKQYVWIPGYWAWDADRKGYIWVSACWRVAPPRMSWVPGYWSKAPGGWAWVSGFWASGDARELEYLPPPPLIQDQGPAGVASSSDMIWVPPCMYWSRGQYVRRNGYWLRAQPNWVWVPSHYVMTPRGYVFSEGHWDYALERRGVLFAPVYFPASYYGRPNYFYTPSIIIDMGLLEVNLFAYPRYNHYFFGDYYDDAYLSIGIYPWFDCRRRHTWYDPIYEHAHWRHGRSNSRWEDHTRDEYRRRCSDRDLRPSRTFREQEIRLSRLNDDQRRGLQVVQSVEVAVSSSRRGTSLKFERIDSNERQRISRESVSVRTFGDDRGRWESRSDDSRSSSSKGRGGSVSVPSARRDSTSGSSRESQGSRSERVQIPNSPVTGRSVESGLFRRGSPSRPSGESRGGGGDSRGGSGSGGGGDSSGDSRGRGRGRDDGR